MVDVKRVKEMLAYCLVKHETFDDLVNPSGKCHYLMVLRFDIEGTQQWTKSVSFNGSFLELR